MRGNSNIVTFPCAVWDGVPLAVSGGFSFYEICDRT